MGHSDSASSSAATVLPSAGAAAATGGASAAGAAAAVVASVWLAADWAAPVDMMKPFPKLLSLVLLCIQIWMANAMQ